MLEVLSKYHQEWIKMARSIGIPKDLLEDYVQRMYVKLHFSVKDENLVLIDRNTPNKGYVWLTIRSLFYDDLKKKNKEIPVEEHELDWRKLMTEAYDTKYDEALDKVLDKIQNEVDGFEFEYDKNMFKSYFLTNLSYRKLSAETGINVTTIHRACVWIKEKLREELSEDYEDLKNGDYDKIK
jgi:DNA-directed RNA polymerase specialized sigma24 family protein